MMHDILVGLVGVATVGLALGIAALNMPGGPRIGESEESEEDESSDDEDDEDGWGGGTAAHGAA